jgi:hypothetical protein
MAAAYVPMLLLLLLLLLSLLVLLNATANTDRQQLLWNNSNAGVRGVPGGGGST